MPKKPPPLERRKPENAAPRVKPEPIKPSDDTSRDVMPPGWRRGLIPKGE